ncbi:MAG: papain fold toxin domain-containing protein [Microcystaceae cyanobacterium]
MQAIASNYKNFECVECANALQNYLISQNIAGKRIKLYTGTAVGWDANIYDDLRQETIALNGRHEGIEVIIEEVAIIYDNLHPEGLPKTQWLDNLQFDGKLYLDRSFQITEQSF